jgi:Flp pilus assembly protein TadD
LADEDDWVRLNCAGSITLFGADAKRAIPELQACLESKDDDLKAAAQQAIQKIESAQPEQAARTAHADAIKQIQAFIKKSMPE